MQKGRWLALTCLMTGCGSSADSAPAGGPSGYQLPDGGVADASTGGAAGHGPDASASGGSSGAAGHLAGGAGGAGGKGGAGTGGAGPAGGAGGASGKSGAGGTGTGTGGAGASGTGGAGASGAGGTGSAGASGAGGAGAGGAGASGTGGAGASGGGGGGMMCTPLSKTCLNSGAAQACRADGSGYDVTLCQVNTACQAGACVCAPGAAECQGGQVFTCDSGGAFQPGAMCPAGTVCLDGLCDDVRCPDETSTALSSNALPTIGWPRFRHDNRNSGFTHAVVADHPTLKWKVLVGGTMLNTSSGGLAGGPVVNQNNVIFIGGGDSDGMGGLFHAFDANAAPIYTFNGPRGYGITTPAVRKDGTAYYSTQDGTAYAVNPDGTQAWKYPFGMQDDCHPIVTRDGYVIYGSDSGSLFALKPTGELLWQSDVTSGPGEVDSGLAETCAGQIYAGGKNGWTALDAKTGAKQWQVPATGPIAALMSSPVVTADGTMYGVDSGGIGYAIDSSGAVKWSKPLGPAGAGTTLTHVADRLFGVLNDGNLHAFDQASGAELWSQPVNQPPEMYIHAGPVVDGKQRLYFNSTDGFVYAFDTSGNQLWKIPSSGISTPGGCCYAGSAIGKDGTLYVPGNDGYLYAFQ